MGFDLITGEILKQLPKKAIVKLTHLYNAAFRLKDVPSYWNAPEVIMLPKPGEPATEVTSTDQHRYCRYCRNCPKN